LSRISRRDLLKGLTAAGMGAGLAPLAGCLPAARDGLVAEENRRPGTRDWLITRSRTHLEQPARSTRIEGYCSRTSVRAGESLDVMVSAAPASPFRLDVYRLGYYGGDGGRLMQQLGPFAGEPQPTPTPGPEGIRACTWKPSLTLEIPGDWPSGVYLGKLTREKGGFQSYVVFVVRDDRPCDFLFQCSDTTWAAYNTWPHESSLYHFAGKDWYSGPGIAVSFDRPYAKYMDLFDAPQSLGSGEFLLWEFPLAYWMESRGYDVSYISNLDTHADGVAGLTRARALLSVGHDEYWTLAMYDAVKAAIAAGTSVGFFSSNTCWGRLELLDNAAGAPARGITRIGQFGPVPPPSLGKYPELALFRANGPSEAGVIGARSIWPYVGYADWVCSAEDSWIYEGTGMRDGDAIPGLIGWEIMGEPAALPGLEVVARAQASSVEGEGTYTATLYPGPKGNWVFNASTSWWGDGLAEPPGYIRPSPRLRGPDRRVERMTTNLFERFLSA
jgi:hypothetical protein